MFASQPLVLDGRTPSDAVSTPPPTWIDPAAALPVLSIVSIVFVLVYVAIDAASFVFPYPPLPVTPWNPNAGLAIAMVIAGGPRYAAAAILAPLVSEFLLHNGGAGSSLAANIAAGLGLGAAYVATALAVRHYVPGIALDRIRDQRLFFFLVVLGNAVSATVYVQFNLPAGGIAPDVELAAILRMWLGDLTGTVGTAPFLLMLNTRAAIGFSREAEGTRGWTQDIVVFLAMLAPLLALVFGLEPIEGHKLFYLLFVPLIVLAMQQGFAGAAIGVFFVQLCLIGAMVATDRSAQSATEFQLLMLVLAVTILLLGAVVSERKRALAELARRSAELRAQQSALADALRVAAASEMASALAHELAQPLSAIGTYARACLELLRKGTAAPAEIMRALERVESETARSGEAVRRIRDFFRSGSSHLEAVRVEALVEDAAAAMRDRVETSGADLQVSVPPELPMVFADRVQIGTALHNLIANALDATADVPDPPVVRIRAHCTAPDIIAIDVEDSGPGVAASVRRDLFAALATTKPAGMGLGLAMSRTILQAHGGEISLAREHPTTFRLTLPTHVVSDP